MITGTPYEEILTGLPVGQQILTGLFLEVTTTEPSVSGQPQSNTIDKTLFDQIWYAAREGGTVSALSINPNGAPALNEQDLTTLLVSPSLENTAQSALG